MGINRNTMNTKFDVLVVGELNVDLILNQIAKFPVIGKEVLANALTITLGSSSAIFASNLSTLGSTVSFTGKLGKDDFGDQIISRLEAKGVYTQNIVRTSMHSTGVTIVLNFAEDRANVTYPGAMHHLTIKDIKESTLRNAKHLHISSLFLQDGLRKDVVDLFRKAKDLGLTTSIDPQWDPAEQWEIELENLLPVVDVFMPNATELMAITQTSSLDYALDRLKDFQTTSVVKNGSAGAYLWDGQALHHQPAFLNTDVVDSIGAGDSFDAGFIHAFVQKKPLKDCLEFGALMGAINTTSAGGTGAFDNLDLVKSIAQSTFNYSL